MALPNLCVILLPTATTPGTPRLGEHWMARIMDKLGRPMVAP